MIKLYQITSLVFLLMAGCTGNPVHQTANEDNPNQLLIVEAKRKLYHADGSRSYTDYEPFETRSISQLPNYSPPSKNYSVSKYGGWKEKQAQATGFFHVSKIGDRWWAVDPEGYLYFNVALNSINMGRSGRNRQALIDKFGTPERWIDETILMLQDNGFNCAGSWSDTQAIREANERMERPFAYTINWNFMSSYGRERGGTYQKPGHTGYPNNAIFVFDPAFEEFCDRHAKRLLETRDDPNLFGHFSDNEMPFQLNSLDNYLGLPEKDHGHQAALRWLKENNLTRDAITDNEREKFLAFVADKYFSIVTAAIKKYDPNHMYLGCRFYSSERNRAEFMKTAGKYLDIISINYYNRWTPDTQEMANWAAWSNRPFIITEYYTKGEDSGMPNQSGAGWIVRTQRDRGLFYQNYNLALLESKNCVGWHYFKYQDNDPTATGVDPSNIDANKGIVDNDYNVWEPMMEKMKELNNQVYHLIEYFDGRGV
jgi:hypothetical protein